MFQSFRLLFLPVFCLALFCGAPAIFMLGPDSSIKLVFAGPSEMFPSPSGPSLKVQGVWETSEGKMKLHQDGKNVAGSYNQNEGRIVGTLLNNTLAGYWIEDSSSQRCSKPREGSNYWGRISFRFTTRDKFEGKWSYCGKKPGSTWTGKRKCFASNPPRGVEGIWKTNEGMMILRKDGNKVTGTYNQNEGRIVGTLSNNTLDGYWIEDGSEPRCSETREGSHYWGRISFLFTPGEFNGKWSYCGEVPSRSWTGKLEFCPDTPTGPKVCEGDAILRQIEQLDQVILALVAAREARIAADELGWRLGDQTLEVGEMREAIQAAVADVRNNIRASDLIQGQVEKLAGDEIAGFAYELRRLYNLSERLGNITQGGFVDIYDHHMGKAFEALSLVDGALGMMEAFAEGGTMSGAEALNHLRDQVDTITNGVALFVRSLNPVIGAMITAYAKALTAASTVAEEVIEPRTRSVNEAIDAAGEALGSHTESTATPSLETQRRAVASFDRAIDALRSRQKELQVCRDRALAEKASLEIRNAHKVARRTLGIDRDTAFGLDDKLDLARKKVESTAHRLAISRRALKNRIKDLKRNQVELEEQLNWLAVLTEHLQKLTNQRPANREASAALEGMIKKTKLEREKTEERVEHSSARQRRLERDLEFRQRRVNELEASLSDYVEIYQNRKKHFDEYRTRLNDLLVRHAPNAQRRLPEKYMITDEPKEDNFYREDRGIYALTAKAKVEIAKLLDELPPLKKRSQ